MFRQNQTHHYITIPNPPNREYTSSLDLLTYLGQNPDLRRQLIRSARHIRVSVHDRIILYHEKLQEPILITSATNDQELLIEIDERIDLRAGDLVRAAAPNAEFLRRILEFDAFMESIS